ncbi:uncharacterized protein METZ01_LOCUS322466, partial [marine metagenome]
WATSARQSSPPIKRRISTSRLTTC